MFKYQPVGYVMCRIKCHVRKFFADEIFHCLFIFNNFVLPNFIAIFLDKGLLSAYPELSGYTMYILFQFVSIWHSIISSLYIVIEDFRSEHMGQILTH